MGTPLYMSPEQAEGKPLDHRSDLYSLGVTMYHMLAGQPPFRGESALALAVQHLKSQAEPLIKVRPELPETLCRIVHRLLEKDPAKRYESARELLRDLRLAATETMGDEAGDDELWQSLGAELAGPMDATRRLNDVMRTAALVRRRPARVWLWLAGGLLAAFGIGVACAWAMRPRPLLPETGTTALDIPRQESAEAQYIYAGLSNTRAAWRSVVDYKPYDEFYALLAKKELAIHYLVDDDRDAAAAIFDELAAESENELRTFGIAGQAVLDSLAGRHREAVARANQVWPLVGYLDRRMVEALWHAVQVSDPANSSAWEEWLNEAFPNQEPASGEPKTSKTPPSTKSPAAPREKTKTQ
jgi:serine/threonine-protein kinase